MGSHSVRTAQRKAKILKYRVLAFFVLKVHTTNAPKSIQYESINQTYDLECESTIYRHLLKRTSQNNQNKRVIFRNY